MQTGSDLDKVSFFGKPFADSDSCNVVVGSPGYNETPAPVVILKVWNMKKQVNNRVSYLNFLVTTALGRDRGSFEIVKITRTELSLFYLTWLGLILLRNITKVLGTAAIQQI